MASGRSRVSRSEVTAAILAGGQGTRVDGQDKGLMLLRGEPLIGRVCRRLGAQACGVLICANRNATEYAQYGKVIADPLPGFRGPLAGISAALSACTTAWLLTVPVDSPAPPDDLRARLADAAGRHARTLAVANDGQRRQPLFALYRRELADSARAALERDLPVWRWQDDCGAIDVDFSDNAAAFANLNVPAEFRAWESRHHG